MKNGPGTEIERLMALLGRLPGLGPRSGKRATLALLKRRETLLLPLLDALQQAAQKVTSCQECGAFSTTQPCPICADETRNPKLMCVVEDDAALWALERGKAFDGRYLVLGGLLSALDHVGPDDVRVALLRERVLTQKPDEIIMALPATVEGQSTAYYLTDEIGLIDKTVRITHLARGVPIGGALDWLDDGTISHALKSRH